MMVIGWRQRGDGELCDPGGSPTTPEFLMDCQSPLTVNDVSKGEDEGGTEMEEQGSHDEDRRRDLAPKMIRV
jgi:hypothetical protein